MTVSQRLFAAGYDLLNWGVEGRLKDYRHQTAGMARGDVLEIGGGTGANLPFYRDDVRLTVVEPNPPHGEAPAGEGRESWSARKGGP